MECQNPSKKDSDEEDNTCLMYSSSYSLIYSKQVSMTTRNYVHISEFFYSVLVLPTHWVYTMQKKKNY